MISEKTGWLRNFELEHSRVLSEQRKGKSTPGMTLADRRNASKDGESYRDQCLIDARCDTYAESIWHRSMLDRALFARAEVRMAFEILARSL